MTIRWKWAAVYNLIPYLIANIGGTLIYIYLSPKLMIISTMTVFPVVYVAFAFLYYLKMKNQSAAFFDIEWKQLTVCWIVLSIALDTLFWMFLLPLYVFPLIYKDYPSHIALSFFLKERSYIWANYLMMIPIIMAGKGLYRLLRRKKEA